MRGLWRRLAYIELELVAEAVYSARQAGVFYPADGQPPLNLMTADSVSFIDRRVRRVEVPRFGARRVCYSLNLVDAAAFPGPVEGPGPWGVLAP